MDNRFGAAYSRSIAADQVLPQLGGRTVVEALATGTDVKSIWLAVCEAFEVPARLR
jgi:hypothetical protein